MAWIESHQTLAGHPKTRKLAHLLGISKPAAIGHLHCFWWWALDYADDGDLSRHDSLDIAIGAEWEGDADAFLDAMIAVGFIDDIDGLHIHDWEDYAGKLVKRRHANAKRMREARAADSEAQNADESTRAAHVQRTQRTRVEPQDQTRPDQTGPDRTGPIEGANAPSKPRKRATQIPRDFRVSDALVEWGAKNEFTREQMESEVPKFLDHWISKGEARKDWDASFRTWMRNARDWGHLNRTPDGALRVHRGGKPDVQSQNDAAFAEVERELYGTSDDDAIDTQWRQTS